MTQLSCLPELCLHYFFVYHTKKFYFNSRKHKYSKTDLVIQKYHYSYCETLSALSNEAQLTNQYQICDNVDLPSVLQDFESYYYVRFQKYPKICKKLNCEDLPYNVPKKCFKLPKKPGKEFKYFFQKFHFKKFLILIVQEVTTQNAVPKSTIKSQSVPKVNQISPRNSLKRTSQQLEGITVLQLGSGNVSETALKEEKQEKILKPLGGFGNQNAEWMSMAEIITKVSFLGLVYFSINLLNQ